MEEPKMKNTEVTWFSLRLQAKEIRGILTNQGMAYTVTVQKCTKRMSQ